MTRRSKTLTRRRRWLLALILLVGACVAYERWRGYREGRQDEAILAAAARYDVDAALVKAVVWRESWFDPRAKGKAGEIGLMQVGELAAREWAEAEGVPLFFHRQLYDPRKNTLAGTWYLRKALRRYAQTDNPLPYGLAEYNAGRANVLKWAIGEAATNSAAFIEQIGFPSTKEYVKAVMQQYDYYRPIFPPPAK